MKKGLFITFEGNDGSGKSTISNMLYEALKKEGYPVILTREPGGDRIAETIRNLILDPNNTDMDARCEALLYAASRRQHLISKVVPAIEAGKIVLCDRFIDSSLAYQGVGRAIGFDAVYQINQFAIDEHMPDRTLFLKLSPEEGLKRIQDRSFKDRLDQESQAFHDRVAEGYQQVLRQFPKRIHIIDASQSIEQVFQDCYEEIMALVKEHENGNS